MARFENAVALAPEQQVRQQIQQRFGSSGNFVSTPEIRRLMAPHHDLSDVRVHRSSSLPAQLNALAFTQSNDIHFGPGHEHNLSHEAWHIVQERAGIVAAYSGGWGR